MTVDPQKPRWTEFKFNLSPSGMRNGICPASEQNSVKMRWQSEYVAGEVRSGAAAKGDLTSAGDCVVTFFGSNEELWQASWRGDFHLNFMPAAVVDEVVWFVTNRILVSQLECDLLEDVVHLGGTSGKESLAAGNAGEFVEDALTFHAHGAAGVAAAQNPHSV